ncbi:hypothetical protein QYF61_022811 [Mycteria americana]|uniref:Uncharacterized protein n=1 Tax=Mycteria americana TaxID=33587 RepID=A0AAN7S0V0_MYCAM|nr:hypothetical protein QYF61_022811 [Mycteria americana]
MLPGPDPLVGLHMPVESAQDELLHNFCRYQALDLIVIIAEFYTIETLPNIQSHSYHTLPSLSEDPSIVGLLRAEEQQVPIATTTVHWQQYRTN